MDAVDLRNGNSDSVAWKVPRTPTTVRAFVQTSDFQEQAVSVPLTIKGATISILSPTGTDSLTLGGTDTIRWSLSDPVSADTVSIYYSATGQGQFTTIASRVPSWKGFYVWNIPANTTPATNGEIVISADGGLLNQQSNTFWLGKRNTGVAEPGAIPSVSLEQNYPNPFSAGDNNITNIPFSLGAAQNISLRVFDVLGRVVFQSPSQFFDAGAHTVLFNASQFQPGAYWYDLLAGTRSLFGARRMMLYVK